MVARQDELRRLMKESKGKTQSAGKARAKTGASAPGKAGGDSTSTTAAVATAPQTNGCVRLPFLIPTLIQTLIIHDTNFDTDTKLIV